MIEIVDKSRANRLRHSFRTSKTDATSHYRENSHFILGEKKRFLVEPQDSNDELDGNDNGDLAVEDCMRGGCSQVTSDRRDCTRIRARDDIFWSCGFIGGDGSSRRHRL